VITCRRRSVAGPANRASTPQSMPATSIPYLPGVGPVARGVDSAAMSQALPTPAEKPPGAQGRDTPCRQPNTESGRARSSPPPASPASRDTNVRAVVDATSRTGRGYLAVRVGRVLLYLADRVAVDARARPRPSDAARQPRGRGVRGAAGRLRARRGPCPAQLRAGPPAAAVAGNGGRFERGGPTRAPPPRCPQLGRRQLAETDSAAILDADPAPPCRSPP